MSWDVYEWLWVQGVFICFSGGKLSLSKLSIGGLFLIKVMVKEDNISQPANSVPLIKPLKVCFLRMWNPKLRTSQPTGSLALQHHPTSLYMRMIWNPKNPKQVHYSAAPIISIIASIVVVFVMSLITGVGV